ncbi:MAG: hypothetical protein A2750_01140 [Candidatus Yanofskybacteria bacterium RIFCSPHIGHO2_01_FULL_45_42]|uniref:Peptidase M16 n=3 Tax=Candidatus Yanofskyibacteriota TaxID=1752733 RepID=A0A1F8F4I1_9BACT|nr:MAG: hypothetical protein A2750_01140 [Candidatus Yanofskybacteria bacterium RIFCSPHIGHO2_01_FULL_45_42]OGN15514.1 MAG: hypothetical protein A3C81_01330 [Candidatus Yanofskybacteria bacterium RIFCSPHIGHO2_02_FULL_46_19]OGN27221.1 MAG: hypothetical protein A3B17_01240 [Candidatus Yanofskybacteria bacterium RIFCSPLOWO2_01_FULL_45_72]OGN31883.1 MAG: hypothetical protein A3J01_01875 [Candidatus Yanofskybacteria bacterium RIFCSPLOWO2_02_FULL_45_18]
MQKGFDHKLYNFDSGLRLIAVPMPATKSVTVLVLAGTGSKYETKEINGISHFLEHMMFKGTAKRPGKMDISRELDSIGADYNAFTSKEYTGYYAKASSDKLPVVMDVISDIFLNSKLDAGEIEIEKGVVIEELNMYRDTPQRYVGDLFEKLLYGDQPAGWDIGGDKETLLKMKRDNFTDYFNSHYIAGNTVVAVAGDIDPEDIKTRIPEYFRNIRDGRAPAKAPTRESQSEPTLLVHWKETDQTHFNLGFRSYHMFDERKYALGMLAAIMGGGMSSRLFEEVRDKRGLAYYIGASGNEYTDTGFFLVRAGVNKEKTLDALKIVLEELRKVRDNGVTEDELKRVKDQVRGQMVLGLESSDNVAEAYADPVLFENRVLTPEEKLDKINKLSVADVNTVAREVLKNEKLNLALIGPFKDLEEFRKILRI